ncbi:hypothetical protein HMPREF3186_01290 [Gemella haemolysans]|jgi:hypothetical protein|uniref:Uncharacterized protein n=1 Tax=Gemella haemolysans TaxID=1379 RepID=A0A133ZUF4_9BACL|nr:hypothetical protein [Gemella haemolysans]KXB59065.1 hypothetical protein HMPREF3186_01290 [Gemella haemolysans]TKW64252.1 MAG: hypothetical protein DI638_01810 [Gemella sp.]
MGKQKILNEVQIKENNKVKELTNFEIEKITGGDFWGDLFELLRMKRRDIVDGKMNNNFFLI